MSELPDIREALVVHPGDTLIVALDNDHRLTMAELDEMRDRLTGHLPTGVKVVILDGIQQLAAAVVRPARPWPWWSRWWRLRAFRKRWREAQQSGHVNVISREGGQQLVADAVASVPPPRPSAPPPPPPPSGARPT